MNEAPAGKGQPYEIVSIKRSDTPDGMEGTDWYAYVIAQGPHIINGYRQGKLNAVTLAVEEVADRSGFSSVQYMYAVFRRLVGQTPGQYRLQAS